jgi:hypothetical protein
MLQASLALLCCGICLPVPSHCCWEGLQVGSPIQGWHSFYVMMAEARQVYRSLLRTISQRVSSRSGNPMWHEYIAQEFRRNAGEKDPERISRLLDLAKDYRNLVESVHYEKARAFLSCWRPFVHKPRHGQKSCRLCRITSRSPWHAI